MLADYMVLCTYAYVLLGALFYLLADIYLLWYLAGSILEKHKSSP
jgi:hypothetical protein